MPERLDLFKAKYDSIQHQLKELAVLDDLLGTPSIPGLWDGKDSGTV